MLAKVWSVRDHIDQRVIIDSQADGYWPGFGQCGATLSVNYHRLCGCQGMAINLPVIPVWKMAGRVGEAWLDSNTSTDNETSS